jgi:hypothetical protein
MSTTLADSSWVERMHLRLGAGRGGIKSYRHSNRFDEGVG